MKRALLIGAGLTALAACGGSATTAGTSSGSSSSAGTAATVTTGTAAGTTILTDSQGHTLYYLTTEQGGHDMCSGQAGCSAQWPPVAPPSSGSPTGGSGVTGTLGTITAADGTKEVTYNGWPLHTFSGEPVGSDSYSGQQSFGGTWMVATPGLTAAGSGAGSVPSASGTSGTGNPYGGGGY